MESNEQKSSPELVKESNLRLCKRCNEVKRRTLSGKYPDNRDKKWVGEDNLLWNGNVCGLCQREKAKENMKKLRDKKKQNNETLP